MQTLNKQATRQELEAALRYYVRFHLKADDVAKVPELAQFLATNNASNTK